MTFVSNFQNIIERFPASLVQEPTAFTSNDAMELYNNILVFIVSGGGGSRSEMHIFQVMEFLPCNFCLRLNLSSILVTKCVRRPFG